MLLNFLRTHASKSMESKKIQIKVFAGLILTLFDLLSKVTFPAN